MVLHKRVVLYKFFSGKRFWLLKFNRESKVQMTGWLWCSGDGGGGGVVMTVVAVV
ncbi:hypothetical protein Hanom_Chr02g00108411 [Helianthus anomalus]